MSIVQVRASQSNQYLSVPAAYRDMDPILAEWCTDAWQSEMFVYPRDYMGDITPQGWDSQSFMLSVDKSGEQAQMMATGKQQTAEEAAEALERLRIATPEQARFIGSLATVNEHNPSVFVAIALEPSTPVIGGIVLHARPSKLRSLKSMFATTEIDYPSV